MNIFLKCFSLAFMNEHTSKDSYKVKKQHAENQVECPSIRHKLQTYLIRIPKNITRILKFMDIYALRKHSISTKDNEA